MKTLVLNETDLRALALGHGLRLAMRECQLAEELSLPVTVAATAHEAVSDADLVVTATSAKDPFLTSDDLTPGTHVSAVGACRPGFRELELRAGPKIFVDSTVACALEADELAGIKIEGEIGLCFAGTLCGRESPGEITVFKSVGLGVEDIFAARFFVRAARANGRGQEIQL